MNHHKLLTLIQSCHAILTFLVNHGLLAARRRCSCGTQMGLRDDNSDDGYHWECLDFISHFTVMQTKTYIFHVLTLPKSICNKRMAKKASISPQNHFLDVETTFCYIFPSSNLQCFPLWWFQSSFRLTRISDCWQLIHYFTVLCYASTVQVTFVLEISNEWRP